MASGEDKTAKAGMGIRENRKKHEPINPVQLVTDSNERDEDFESGSLWRAETPSGT